MGFRKFLPIAYAAACAIAAFAVHKSALHFGFPGLEDTFYYPIATVYGFFLACSVAILAILIFIRHKSIDNVGYTFLFLTCAKMGVAYAFLHRAISENGPRIADEKINFFIVFAIFLTIETVLTIRILGDAK
jgi:ABC-type transport system involved in cytochrome c biogenesis permease subunit